MNSNQWQVQWRMGNYKGNYNSASTYSATMAGVKLVPNHSMIYYVDNNYPFEINKIYTSDLAINSIGDFSKAMSQREKIFNSHRHNNRFAAEYDRLKKLYHHHKRLNENVEASIFFKQLKNLEEEHPEWLI